MENTFHITSTTTSGWLISKTLVKDAKQKRCILKKKELLQLSDVSDKEMNEGLTNGTWAFVDETK